MISNPTNTYETVDDWIAGESIPVSFDARNRFNAAVDKVIASLGDSVELLGFGEALHGGEEILELFEVFFVHTRVVSFNIRLVFVNDFPVRPMPLCVTN